MTDNRHIDANFDAEDRADIAKAVVIAALSVAATELVKWGVKKLKARFGDE